VTTWLILIKVFTFNQSNFSTISKSTFNHMKVSKFNQSNFSIKI